MFDIGGGELMLILIAVLIFFGPRKLPELAQSLGRGMREFKKAQREFTSHISSAFEEEQRKVSRSAPAETPGNTIARGSTAGATAASSPSAEPEPEPAPTQQPATPQNGSGPTTHQAL